MLEDLGDPPIGPESTWPAVKPQVGAMGEAIIS